MRQEAIHGVRLVLIAIVLLGLVPAARGATLYAANNGLDSPTCGTSASPCRSITRTLANAAAGDTIQVRPGVYSADLNSNGTLGEPGEETPSFGAMLTILKSIIILSTDGAAATVIDARNVSTNSNVLIVTGNAEFGRPEHGFTVTNTSKGSDGTGIAVQGVNIKVRGNQLINNFTASGDPVGTGIQTESFPATVLIEQNQVVGWGTAIQVRGEGNTVSKNHLSMNFNGILALRGSVAGNVVSRNGVAELGAGVFLANDAGAVGNAIYGNSVGFVVSSPFTGVIQKNNIFGNGCGLRNNGNNNLSATGNYWGASTGPGPDPADELCEDSVGTTVTTPFATARFAINPTFEP